jgi:pyruvate dehydrogenase E2 component (dihydrolipoamide acetyltransferase)
VRKIIAERMRASLQSTAQLTMSAAADATKLLGYRARLKQSNDEALTSVSINDLVLFAVSRSLADFRDLNATFESGTIRRFSSVNLGFAVDTERGLMVPVIRGADRLSLVELAKEAHRLASACVDASIGPDEMSGGTFTVTNLGGLGIRSFTPVLNAPQVAILGVCSIEPAPVITDGETRFVPHIGLSLTIDHQVVDGAPAARYLQQLTRTLKDIDITLAR